LRIDKVRTDSIVYSVKFKYDFSREKDALLKQTRGIGFSDVIEATKKGKLLDDIEHFNKKKYPNQKILIIKVEKKIYAVPYVIDNKKKREFLKTIYPSRKLKKMYDNE